jgi:hypothetical protein
MEEQPFGLPQYKNKNLLEFLENFCEEALLLSAGYKHSCEAISFQLSYRLEDSLVANVSSHTFVYYKGLIWIDLYVGIIIDKNFKKYQKLPYFNQIAFDSWWSKNGIIFSGKKIFTFIEIKRKGIKKIRCGVDLNES